MWAYVVFGGILLALVGLVFWWLKHRERQAVRAERAGAEAAALAATLKGQKRVTEAVGKDAALDVEARAKVEAERKKQGL